VRLGELLRAEAYDADGDDLGQVHDVRLRHSVTPDGRHRLVVESVIVGAGALSARLGYTYGDVQGPWLLTRIFRRLGRGARRADWGDVAWSDGRVDVRRRAHELPHPGETGDD
jgi:hypothetical protein